MVKVIFGEKFAKLKMVYNDRSGLKNHCIQNNSCLQHRILYEYLERLHPDTKDKKKKGKTNEYK